GAVGGYLFWLVLDKILWNLPHNGFAALTLGPPLMLLCFLAGSVIEIGGLGTVLQEDAREWWASVDGLLLMYAVGWSALFGIAIYGPWVTTLAVEYAPVLASSTLLTGWLTTAVGGALAGRSAKTRSGRGIRWMEWLGQIAPVVFLIGLVAATSLFLRYLL